MPFLYHPFAVHFPIALLLTSAILDVVYMVTRERFYDRAARFLIGVGLLGALIAVILGFVDFGALVAADVGQALIDAHRAHSMFAYGALAVYLGAFVLRWRRPDLSRAVVGIFLLAGAGLIIMATWHGSQIRKVM